MNGGKVFAWIALALLVAGGLGWGILTWNGRRADQRLERDLSLVRNYQSQGEWDQALAILDERRAAARPKDEWILQVENLRLQILERSDPQAAIALAQDLLDADPDATDYLHLQAHRIVGQATLDAGRADAAAPHFDAILAVNGLTGYESDAARLGNLRIRLATAGVSHDVQTQLEQLMADFPQSPYLEEIQFVLGQCNLRLLLSPIPGEQDTIYTVQKGDSVYTLARKHRISQDLLLQVNGIANPRLLSVGRRLKIPVIDFAIEINKSTNTLDLTNGGRFFKRYAVRTGRYEYLTPPGEYRIQSKKKNPQWSDPKTGRTYAPNDPENELGSRWIGFQDPSLGIHGTIHPETIGGYASNGCVGMLKQDVEELFDLVRVGTPLKIVGQTLVEASTPM